MNSMVTPPPPLQDLVVGAIYTYMYIEICEIPTFASRVVHMLTLCF